MGSYLWRLVTKPPPTSKKSFRPLNVQETFMRVRTTSGWYYSILYIFWDINFVQFKLSKIVLGGTPLLNYEMNFCTVQPWRMILQMLRLSDLVYFLYYFVGFFTDSNRGFCR